MEIVQEIWLASYLQPSRFDSFQRALKSFNEQTVKAHVVLSVCGPEAWRAQEWVKENLVDVTWELHVYTARFSQFDQIYKLLASKRGREVYLSFCDDDDYYTPNRIEVQEKYLKENPQLNLYCNTGGLNRDFACLCVHQRRLEDFFANDQLKPLINSTLPDVVFRTTLKLYELEEVLYIRKSSFLDATYTQMRENGEPWYTMTCI